MSEPGHALNDAALRLWADPAAAAERIELLERWGDVRAADPLTQLLRENAAWPALEDWLLRTLREKRPTLVYGDYDVDGATSGFMFFRWLRGQGVPCNVFLPSRFKHGYGLDSSVIRQAHEQGYTQLLVLDCGTANLDEIALARELGIDAAVIDHHTPLDELPDALLLNPHASPGLPPLCTAGLVYAVLRRMELLSGDAPADDLPELAGLATLADVVPLVPHNWALAHLALLRLPRTGNFGLSELIKAARLDALDRLTARQAGFSLAPRLNAAGRMANARLIVELFGAPDREAARNTVVRLDQLNAERRVQTDRVEAAAVRQALDLGLPAALALYGPDWHPGVLGIVAARVAERFGKPAAILSDAPGGGGLLSGSARAGAAVTDVLALLQASADTLLSCGGHAQAAGLKLEFSALDSFRSAFSFAAEEAASHSAASDPASAAAEQQLVELKLHELTSGLEELLWRLAPFGPAWPAPRVALSGCRLLRASYMGSEKLHANLVVTDGSAEVRIAAFNQSHLVSQLSAGQALRPIVELEPDNWNNRLGLMLRLLALD